MSFDDLKRRALKIKEKYSDLNRAKGQNVWDGKDYAMGFVGDVGDLQKLIMSIENMRLIDDDRAKLGHELSDCLWSIIVLADYYEVNIEEQFKENMDMLDEKIEKELNK